MFAHDNLIILILALKFHYMTATDCVVGDWSLWGSCNSNCTIGRTVRSRVVLQKATNIFSKACPNLFEEKPCGTKNNGCQDFCEKSTGRCLCFSGYMLKADGKSCTDVNECNPNDNKGPCSNICNNLQGGYQCSCPKGLYLQEDSHSCGHTKPYHDCIADGIHKYDNNKCVCKNNLLGLECDRDEKRCSSNFICRNTEYCTKFIEAPNTCVPKDEQIPILIAMSPEIYIDGMTKYHMEHYLSATLDRKTNGEKFEAWKFNNRKGKTNKDKYYSEAMYSIDVLDEHVLVTYVVLESPVYRALKYHQICPLLQNTEMQCVSSGDCEILEKASINCSTFINKSFQQSTEHEKKTWLLGVVVGISLFLIIIVILFILAMLLRRRKKYRNADYSVPQTHLLVDDEQHNQLNVLYGREEGEPSCPLYESIDNLKTCESLVEDPHEEGNNDACLMEKYNNVPPNYDIPRSKHHKEEGTGLVVDIPEPRYASPPTLSRK